MDSLIDNFDKYYPKNEQIVKDDWIRDPFLARDLPAHFDHKENEELIDLITDVSLQATFMKEELADFRGTQNSGNFFQNFHICFSE